MEPREARWMLKGYDRRNLEDRKSDQMRGLPRPGIQKPVSGDGERVELVPADALKMGDMSLRQVILQRRSRRKFTETPLTREELSFLLFATQGVQEIIRNQQDEPLATIRTVPSAGARHAFETYIVVLNVEGITPGLYRYLPLEHQLAAENHDDNLSEKVIDACCGQRFTGKGAVVFIWTAVPYRMEWRYHDSSAKFISLDAGHLCQNLYLAAESIGAGTCGIGAYFDDLANEIVGVDGENEIVVYIAPVGKVRVHRRVHLRSEDMAKFEGSYRREPGGETLVTVSRAGDQLIFDIPDRVRFKLTPFAANKFVADDYGDMEVEFKTDNGRITGMVLDQFGELVEFVRISG